MYVELGHSQEMANGTWNKFKTGLDDGDFRSIIRELLATTEHSSLAIEDVEQHFTTSQKWQVLEHEGQRLMLTELMSRFSTALKSEENIARVRDHTGARNKIVLAAIARAAGTSE